MARAAAQALAILALLLVPVGGAAGAEPTRSEYVATLEKICKPRSEATQRAVHGTRADVQAERFAVAAGKFSMARRIFAGTVRAISRVPRPGSDRATLKRWFAALDRETTYLGQSATALRVEDIARFQRVSGQFFRQGSKANNIVVSFGFDYCAFKASRFE